MKTAVDLFALKPKKQKNKPITKLTDVLSNHLANTSHKQTQIDFLA